MIPTLKYSAHPIASIFPMIEGKDMDDFIADIREHGQIEPGILLDGLLLDGRNRQVAALKAGRPFFAQDWSKLPKDVQAMGPVAYVISRNGKRRQLNASQKAAFAIDALPFFEAEAAQKKAENLKGSPKAPDGAFGNEPKAKPEKSSEKAAKATGASARNIERAKKLKTASPKKFAKVKAGKMTLTAALRDKKAEAKAEAKAKAAAKGIKATDKIGVLINGAEGNKGKLSVIIDGFKIVITKLKAKIAKAKKK